MFSWLESWNTNSSTPSDDLYSEQILNIDLKDVKNVDISEEEKTKIETFRNLISQSDIQSQYPESKYLNLSIIEPDLPLRFIRAHKDSVELAFTQFKETIIWRHENDVDNALSWNFPSLCQISQAQPLGFHGKDRLGRPLIISRYGALNVEKLIDITSFEELRRIEIQRQEFFYDILLKRNRQQNPRNVMTSACIMDLSGMGKRHLFRALIDHLRMVADIGKRHYPERIGIVFIVNLSMIYEKIFNFIIKFMTPNANERTIILGSDYKKQLRKYFLPGSLPLFLGGDCECVALPWDTVGLTEDDHFEPCCSGHKDEKELRMSAGAYNNEGVISNIKGSTDKTLIKEQIELLEDEELDDILNEEEKNKDLGRVSE